MTDIAFQNFDLLIDTNANKPGVYRVNVISSPAGQAQGVMVLPFDFAQVADFHRLLRLSKPVPIKLIRKVGEQIYNGLFAEEVRIVLRQSLQAVNAAGGGLRLRLQLDDDPLLWAAPWEYLYEPASRQFLAQSATTPVVRTVPLTRVVPFTSIISPLKILVVMVNPGEQAQAKEAEWRHIAATLREASAKGAVSLSCLRVNQLNELQRQWRNSPVHVVHFLGAEGFHTTVDNAKLPWLLQDQPLLRLVVLTGRPPRNRPSSLALHQLTHQLLQQGTPAVVAAQFTQRPTALAFIGEFYSALSDGYAIEAAMGEARKAVAFQQVDAWGAPILGMLMSDGNLFSLPVNAAQPPTSRSGRQASGEDNLSDALAQPVVSPMPAFDPAALSEQPFKWPPLWRTQRPLDSPEIMTWLNMARLQFTPFGPESAELDHELTRYHVNPNAFNRHLRNAHSAVVFGALGSGKTACRFLIAQACRARLPTAGAFPIICTWRSGAMTDATLAGIQKFAIDYLVRALVPFFALNPASFLRLAPANKFAVVACLCKELGTYGNIRAQLRAAGLEDDPAGMALSAELQALVTELAEAIFSAEKWTDLLALARPAGFAHSYFICDLDRVTLTTLQADVAFLQALIEYIVSPDLKAVYLKALLPDTLQPYLTIPGHVATDHLTWTTDELVALLSFRVFSEDGFKMYFEQLFNQATAKTNPARRLAQAANGSPQRLIRLGNQLLAKHVERRPEEIELTDDELTAVLQQ